MTTMTKVEFKTGRWQVTRLCCTSHMCFSCKGQKQRLRIVHTHGVSEEWARYVAGNWDRYDAKAEKMT